MFEPKKQQPVAPGRVVHTPGDDPVFTPRVAVPDTHKAPDPAQQRAKEAPDHEYSAPADIGITAANAGRGADAKFNAELESRKDEELAALRAELKALKDRELEVSSAEAAMMAEKLTSNKPVPGLRAVDVDPTKLKRAVLTMDGWVCPVTVPLASER